MSGDHTDDGAPKPNVPDQSADGETWDSDAAWRTTENALRCGAQVVMLTAADAAMEGNLNTPREAVQALLALQHMMQSAQKRGRNPHGLVKRSAAHEDGEE